MQRSATLNKAVEALTPLQERFAGQTAFIFAPGPSLPRIWCGRQTYLPKICVNDAWCDPRPTSDPKYLGVIVPWPDIIYASDKKWWEVRCGLPKFSGGLKVSYDGSRFDDVICVQWSSIGSIGYDPEIGRMCHGSNSGYAATHLAAQLGATTIVLVGFDMRSIDDQPHYFGKHVPMIRMTPNYSGWAANFLKLKGELNRRGITLLNATPGSTLKIPFISLDQILGKKAA